jgi:hypothetical protein
VVGRARYCGSGGTRHAPEGKAHNAFVFFGASGALREEDERVVVQYRVWAKARGHRPCTAVHRAYERLALKEGAFSEHLPTCQRADSDAMIAQKAL